MVMGYLFYGTGKYSELLFHQQILINISMSLLIISLIFDIIRTMYKGYLKKELVDLDIFWLIKIASFSGNDKVYSKVKQLEFFKEGLLSYSENNSNLEELKLFLVCIKNYKSKINLPSIVTTVFSILTGIGIFRDLSLPSANVYLVEYYFPLFFTASYLIIASYYLKIERIREAILIDYTITLIDLIIKNEGSTSHLEDNN